LGEAKSLIFITVSERSVACGYRGVTRNCLQGRTAQKSSAFGFAQLRVRQLSVGGFASAGRRFALTCGYEDFAFQAFTNKNIQQ